MDLNEIKAFIEQNKDSEEVSNFVNSFVSTDKIEKFLEGDEGKKILQPRIDKHFTKGLETWKQNNLSKLIEDEISKRYPAETPEAKQLRELQEKLVQMETTTQREKLKNSALKTASEKGLPASILDFMSADSEEAYRDALSVLEADFKAKLEAAVNEKLKGKTPTAAASNGVDGGEMTKEKLMKMSVKDRTDFFNKNQELFRKLMNS